MGCREGTQGLKESMNTGAGVWGNCSRISRSLGLPEYGGKEWQGLKLDKNSPLLQEAFLIKDLTFSSK